MKMLRFMKGVESINILQLILVEYCSNDPKVFVLCLSLFSCLK